METYTMKNPQPPKVERKDMKSPKSNNKFQDIGGGFGVDNMDSPPVSINRVKNNNLMHSNSQNRYQMIENDNKVQIDWTPMDVGLENLGNTCFMNSMLQCLLHIEPLITYFLQTNNIESKLNLASPKKGKLALSFWQLVHDVYKKGTTSISPVNLQKAVFAHAPYLMDYQQQDSQEFLRFLLDGISEDLCRKHSENNDNDNTYNNTSIITVTNTSKKDPMNNNSISLNRIQTTNNLSILPALCIPSQSTASSTMSSPATNSLAAAELSLTPLNIQQSTNHHYHASSPFTTSQNASQQHQQRQLQGKHFNDEDNSSTTAQHNNSAPSSPIFPSVHTTNNNHHQHLSSKLSQRITRSSGTFSLSSSMESTTSSSNEQSNQHFSNTPILNQPSRNNYNPQPTLATVMIHNNEDLTSSIDDSSNVGLNYELNNSGNCSYKSRIRKDVNIARLSQDCDSVTEMITVSSSPIKLPNQLIKKKVNHNSNNTKYDLNSIKKPESIEKEAEISWEKYLKLNDSIITDIFAGQLQSTIKCLTCNHKSSSFDPFLDLSVPIYRGENTEPSTKIQSSSMLSALKSTVINSISDNNKTSTLEKCLGKFTAEEILDGDNMYICEKCKTKQKCVKQLSVYRIPKILVIHIKRFRFNSMRREKLSTDVQFPVNGLDLTPYLSNDIKHNSEDHHHQEHHNIINGINYKQPIYDLVGISNHHGNLNSGHYIAHVDTTYATHYNQSTFTSSSSHSATTTTPITNSSIGVNNNTVEGNPSSKWKCFNDTRVSEVSIQNIKGPTAYVLFYKLRI